VFAGHIASLLQVACRTHAFLFDLKQWNDDMDDVLTSLFESPFIAKLGGYSHSFTTISSTLMQRLTVLSVILNRIWSR
jgi:hypothetical protein